MALTDNLVAYWKLDETSGTRSDSHGTNHLTDNNTVGSATGKINNGADFEDTNNEYLSIVDASQSGLDPVQDGSMSFSWWMQPESHPTNAYIFNKLTSQAGPYRIILVGNSGSEYILFGWHNAANTGVNRRQTANDIAPIGEMHHWVVTMDFSQGAAGLKMYKDGTLLTTSVTNDDGGEAAGNGEKFTIGCANADGSPTAFFDGIIDEVGIWNGKILSQAEVTSLYNGGAGLAYENFGGAAGPANVKTMKGLAIASVKTKKGLAIASVKTAKGLA